MTLPEYIKQTRTTDLVNTVKHAALGLISEVGEVYGVLAKIERGDKIDRAERMTGELGDVAWFLARLTDLNQIKEIGPLLLHNYPHDTFDDLTHNLIGLAYRHLIRPDERVQEGYFRHAWTRWARLCQIENLDPLTVLESNLAKLRDRAARRVLQGDGDHR